MREPSSSTSQRAVEVFKWNCGIPGRAKGPWEAALLSLKLAETRLQGATYALTMEFTEDYPSKPPKCKFAHVRHLSLATLGFIMSSCRCTESRCSIQTCILRAPFALAS